MLLTLDFAAAVIGRSFSFNSPSISERKPSKLVADFSQFLHLVLLVFWKVPYNLAYKTPPVAREHFNIL